MDAIKDKDAFIKYTRERLRQSPTGLRYKVVTLEMILFSQAYFLRFLKYLEVWFL